MKLYLITFVNSEGEQNAENVEANDCGHAYAKILKKYPGSEIVRGLISRKAAGGSIMWMEYDPVSAQSPTPLPSDKLTQIEMELGDPRRIRQ